MAVTRWNIRSWEKGPCPDHAAFKVSSDLIWKKGSETNTLVWLNDDNRLCWIEDLPNPVDEPHDVEVYFGLARPEKYRVTLTLLTLDPSNPSLIGSLQPLRSGNDGSAGQFGADGNGPFLQDEVPR